LRALVIASAVYALEGGIERFNRRLVRSLDEVRQGGGLDEVRVLGLWDTPEAGAAAPEGVGFVAASSKRSRFIRRFVSLLLQHRPGVIIYGHVRFAPLVVLGRLVRPGSQHLLVVHGVEVWDAPRPLHGWIVRNFVDRIVAVSLYSAKRMSASYGVPENRFRILPNAMDPAPERSAEPGTAGANVEGRWRLMIVSRLSLIDVYKNVDKVILALPQIAASFPDTHCHIVGDGPWRGALERLARENGVADAVHFHGQVAERVKEALLEASHIFVLPSTGEGFGIVFLEAWRHRVPVITSNEGAASEVVRHGIEGLCVEPTAEQIAEAVISLLGDPRRRQEMGERGHRRLLENYSHERFGETLSSILTEVARCAA